MKSAANRSLTESQQKLLYDIAITIKSPHVTGTEQASGSGGRGTSGLKRRYESALRLSKVIPDAQALDDFSEAAEADVGEWLLDFPFELAEAGMAAEAGMRAEALEQIAELNKEFPDNVSVQLSIGGAWKALKDLDKAEEIYRRALETAIEDYTGIC